MMVSHSYSQLNYGGHEDDGLVHRFLASYAVRMKPMLTREGVPHEMIQSYKDVMKQLFPCPAKWPPETTGLTYDKKAEDASFTWGNKLYEELGDDSPGWLASKYRKLWEYVNRVALVLHEIRRVCGDKVEPTTVDCETVQRAIRVIEYFKGHIPRCQRLLHLMAADYVDRHHERLKKIGVISTRECIHHGAPFRNATSEQVLAMFNEWQERGYGSITRLLNKSYAFRFLEVAVSSS
jgi:hypothetical protein